MNFFVGVDVSKEKFDVCCINESGVLACIHIEAFF